MVRCTSFRFFRALRVLCSPRYFIMATMVTVTLWLFPPPRWSVLRLVVPSTEKNVPVTLSFSGNRSSATNSSSFSSSPILVNTSLSSTVLPWLASTISGYLSQRAPMAGTGQGNLMFMYASLLGIAYHAQMIPDYPADGPLKKIFAISTRQMNAAYTMSITEAKACAFDANLFSLSNRKQNITIIGYLQSWRYFSDITDRIKQEFMFNEDLRGQAQNFLRSISLGNKTTTTTHLRSTNETLYIGVHVRRRDMLATYNVARGYTVASKEYLAAAVSHFRTQFPASALVFVVCGDDGDWSRENFPTVDGNSLVAFSENRTAGQDMAILAACNHTIITVGTFGWWSGYLAGGQTIYYKNFPTPGTYIDSLLTRADYYPPHWIGL